VPPLRARGASPFTLSRSSFSRSYGGNLPSSLTTVLPIALVFSTCPPVSVWGTGTVPTHCWAFLGSMGSVTSPVSARHRVSASMVPTFIGTRLHAYPRTTNAWDHLPSCVPHQLPAIGWSVRRPEGRQPLSTRCWAGRGHGGTGISTGCASTTPLGLALAPDLPWAD
jgi:hypothetical protein